MALDREPLKRALGSAALALTLTALAAGAAEARGFVRFGLAVGPPIYPPPLVYAPPPVYYVPPPPIVYPPPAYYTPPPPYAAPPPYAQAPPYAASAAPVAGPQCREYQSTTMINGQPQQIVGTACPQPDGTWRIVK